MVTIGLCGSNGSGKETIKQYLISRHGFVPLSVCPSAPGQDELDRKIACDSSGEGNDGHICFRKFEELDRFVTKEWLARYVISDIRDAEAIEVLSKRPFFLLVSVDAPVSVRYRRFLNKNGVAPESHSLEKFVVSSDHHLYNSVDGLAKIQDRAKLRILNAGGSLKDFHDALDEIDLMDNNRFRPSWDAYFMRLANLAALRSNCMKRRVGCVLAKENRVISTGYNGTPRGLVNCNQGGCPRCNGGAIGGSSLATCLCLHAEENALLEAGKERIGVSTVLYCNTCPCLTCSVKITQVGIKEVVFHASYSMDLVSADVLKNGGVKLRQFTPPEDSLILT